MRIDHVGLYVADLESAKAFFEKFFEATSNSMYHNPRTGLRTYFLTFPDGGRLELLQRDGVVAVGKSDAVASVHVSLSVGSKERVDAMAKQLDAAGFAVLDGPRTTGDGYYEASIAGPEGLRIEVTA